MKKKTDEQICDTINNQDLDTQIGKATAASLLSRAVNPKSKATNRKTL